MINEEKILWYETLQSFEKQTEPTETKNEQLGYTAARDSWK